MPGVRTPILLGLLAAAVSILHGSDIATADDGGADEQPAQGQVRPAGPLPPKPAYPRLDSRLNLLARRSGPDPTDASNVPLYREEPVPVTIRLLDGLASTLDFLERNGAVVASAGAAYIEAHVPVGLLASLDRRPGVLRVESLVAPRPDVTSQGAVLHGSPPWNARGLTGQGVRVGIIDVGFQGYVGLMGSELPATVVARCYTDIGAFTSNPGDCEIGGPHGTAVAEAVADVAPGASLYIADPFTPGDLQATALWMASQGVAVINHSVGWVWSGPGDGTSPFGESPLVTVGLAVDQGVTWVNSAGNAAQDSWRGGFTDSDGDGWLEFAPGQEGNAVQLSAGEALVAQARWDDAWGNSSRDLDLFLFDSTGAAILDSSQSFQQGSVGQDPFELIYFTAPAGGTYLLSIRRFSGTTPSWVQLNAFTGQNLAIPVASYSIGSPAESAATGMLAVGAAYWATPGTIEPFSSRGPTTDGRTKPDIVGADRGDSVSYGPGGFAGTSQSAPLVSGLAALVLQRFPGLTPEDVAAYLKGQAAPRGAVPNNTWGYGLALLPPLRPGAPADVTAVPGDGRATVGWTAPADGGSPITQYTTTSDPQGRTATVAGTTTTAVVTGLTNGVTYTFTVTAANAVGTGPPSAPSNTVVPVNLPPAVQAVDGFAADEGEALSLAVANFSDPDPLDTHTSSIDWGDGATTAGAVSEAGGAGSVSGGHTYADDGVYTVTIAVTDSAGGSGLDSLTVTVNNVAPVVDAGPDLTATGASLSMGHVVSFTDPGALDTHTAVVDWGDGTVEEAIVDQSAMTLVAGHRYEATGVYTVTFTVTDDEGGSGSDSLQVDVQSAPVVVSIPGVTQWGLVALGAVLGLLLAVRLRRRTVGRATPRV